MTQPANGRLLWYYRRLNTEYLALTIDIDGLLKFQFVKSGSAFVRPLNAYVTTAERVRVAVHYSDTLLDNVFGYVGFGENDPSPIRSPDGTYQHPDIYTGMIDYLLCAQPSPAAAFSGTIHLREHRFYNCATEESFVEDLAKGLVTEIPL